MNNEQEHKGLSFKIILIGDSGIGKTSLIHQYIHGKFKQQYQVTVGVDFSSKTLIVENKPLQLQIWDTCGQDVYKAITNSFYRGAAGVFLVFSINSQQSFDRMQKWLEQFYEKGSDTAFVFLIGTKCDLEREVKNEEAVQFLQKIKGVFYIETSAKTGDRVQQLFKKAAQTMYKYYAVSKDFRDLVKPQRTTYIGSQLPNSRLPSTLKTSQPKKKCC